MRRIVVFMLISLFVGVIGLTNQNNILYSSDEDYQGTNPQLEQQFAPLEEPQEALNEEQQQTGFEREGQTDTTL